MREFFGGWRRKAGCVTLLITCVFVGVLVRVNVVTDVFVFNGVDDGFHEMKLTKTGIMWGRYKSLGNARLSHTNGWRLQGQINNGTLELTHLSKGKNGWEWRKEFGGFDFGETSGKLSGDADMGFQVSLWVVPLLPFAMVLTPLSAWLLLSKPRKPAAVPSNEAV